MPDAASVGGCATSRSTTRICKSVRPAVIKTLLSLLTLFGSTAEAGNVQFSSTVPVVVDSSTAASAQQNGPQPVIRRGREPSAPKLLRAGPTESVQEFAPQPNSIRAVMRPVTEAEAMAHDSQVARDLPAGINLGGTIETLAKLDTKRTHPAADDVRLQKFAPPKQGLLRSGGVTGANRIINNKAPPPPPSIEKLARDLR